MPLFSGKIGVTLIFIVIHTHQIVSLRVSKRCPFGNYFTDGCVTCFCDPNSGQSTCDNMIACPRKKIKCPMGSKYEDECGNDCTCYENTGALFCKEKGPCNSIKRRNIWVPPPPAASQAKGKMPPPPPVQPQPRPYHNTDSAIKMELEHADFRDKFEIPSSVQLPKEDLVIEPALIIRRKSFKNPEDKKKHPTTLLYLYEKQLKSMKDFKQYYKQYLDSESAQSQNHLKNVTHKYHNTKQFASDASAKLQTEMYLKSMKVVTSPNKQDIHWSFQSPRKYTQTTFLTTPSTTTSRPLQNFTRYQPDYPNSKYNVKDQPKSEAPSPKYAIYDVATTMRPFYSSTKPPRHYHPPSTTPRTVYIDYYNPNLTTQSPPPPILHFYTAAPVNPSSTPKPHPPAPQNNAKVQIPNNNANFMDHIPATRKYPELYQTSGSKQISVSLPPPPSYSYHHTHTHYPPQLQPLQPQQYKLFIKSAAKKPFFYSHHNRVPLFVDKIAREFFRKPVIYVPKINMVGGRQQLQLDRVVYHHKEMIPKELVLEEGGPSVKVKFTPQAEAEMNREWMQAWKDSENVKKNMALGYQHSPQKNFRNYPENSRREDYLPVTYQQSTYHPETNPTPTYSTYFNPTPRTRPRYPQPVQQVPKEPQYEEKDYILRPIYPNPVEEIVTEKNYPQYDTQDIVPQIPPASPIPEPPYEDYSPATEGLSEYPKNTKVSQYSFTASTHPPETPSISELSPQSDYDYNPSHSPSTSTEYIPVSPRPDMSSQTFQIPDDYGPSPTYDYSDLLPQPSDNSHTILIDSVVKAESVEQPANHKIISVQDVLSHKKGNSGVTSTTPPSTTEFNAEKILREILALDPDIGPDAVLFKENGETIPPLSTTTTPTPKISSSSYINIKGDSGLLSHSTVEPPPETNSSSFEQFYQNLFRPQRAEKKVKPDAHLATEGVAKIFQYDKILKTFTSEDSSKPKENPGDVILPDSESITIRYLDKREKSKKNRRKNRKSGKNETERAKNETKPAAINFSTVIKTTKVSSTTLKPSILTGGGDKAPKGNGRDDPATSFKRELDWKSNLMSDICSVDPNSALCFTYKSLCMLMST